MAELKLTDAAILNLIKQGTVTKEVKITDGITIVLKNLTQEDRENYSKLIELPKVKNKKKKKVKKNQKKN